MNPTEPVIARYFTLPIALDGRPSPLRRSCGIGAESTQKLDRIANDAFLQAFAYGELVSEVVSEEMEQPAAIQGNADKGKYVIFVDPLERVPLLMGSSADVSLAESFYK